MPKPVCIKCERFYRAEKNGYVLLEQMPDNGARPGVVDRHLWRPYKVWRCDKWKCEGCGHEIAVGFGSQPIGVQHQDHFRELLPEVDSVVNDC